MTPLRIKGQTRVWYRDIGGPYGDQHWNMGVVRSPVQPDSAEYWVMIEGDPMRVRKVHRADIRLYVN
jgi:hypothetical protein